MPRLSQSTILVGALLAAFIVWLAMNGRLNAYWALLTGGGATTTTAGTSSTPSTGGLTGSTTGAIPGTAGGVASPGGSGGPLTITVTPLLGNVLRNSPF